MSGREEKLHGYNRGPADLPLRLFKKPVLKTETQITYYITKSIKGRPKK